jgi:hypothetical protein
VIKVFFNCLANCFHIGPGNESLARRLESGVSGLLLTYSIFLKGVIIYIFFQFFDTFKMNTGFFYQSGHIFSSQAAPGPILLPVAFCMFEMTRDTKYLNDQISNPDLQITHFKVQVYSLYRQCQWFILEKLLCSGQPCFG